MRIRPDFDWLGMIWCITMVVVLLAIIAWVTLP